MSVCAFFFQPLGAVDYIHITQEFDTVILRGIPQLTLSRKTEGRRFITLIDTLYDSKVSRRVTNEVLTELTV